MRRDSGAIARLSLANRRQPDPGLGGVVDNRLVSEGWSAWFQADHLDARGWKNPCLRIHADAMRGEEERHGKSGKLRPSQPLGSEELPGSAGGTDDARCQGTTLRARPDKVHSR